VLVILIVVFSVPVVLSAFHHSSESAPVKACKSEVLNELKAPLTAKWGAVFAVRQNYNGFEAYKVDGSVNADNSFGALIKNDFTCTVHRDKGQWLTNVDSLGNS
jgi:hypothetical protein